MTSIASRRRTLAALLGLALAGVATSASSASSATATAAAERARPLRVVATFSILADMARVVGGDAVQVDALVGPDGDAHVFEPRPVDARRLAEADLVLANGLGFEGWVDRLVKTSGYRGPVVVASAGITARRERLSLDPHAWQDLAHARRYVTNLRDAFVHARPASAEDIRGRADRYLAQIADLDARVRAVFEGIPAAHRRVITSHDAFGYFADAYGIRFLAPQGMNTDSEASAATVARLVDQIRKEGVQAVFVENITNPRLIERIAREGGATVGPRLYSDALSAPGTAADTYLKMFAHNADAIAAALTAPSPR